MKVIYRTKFHCKFCKKDIALNVYGSDENVDGQNNEFDKEVKEWGEHYHWIDTHRRCALCGGLVTSDDLELLVNDGKIRIHKEYEAQTYEETHKGQLLTVHGKCIKGGNDESGR